MKAKFLLALALVLLLTVACSQFRQDAEERKYFTGSEGVDISFLPNAPPQEVFYRGEPIPFEISVQVDNKGASLTKGGIYISGYDPTMIDIQEIEEDRGFFDNCHYSIEGLDYGKFQAFLQCRRLGAGDTDLGVSVGESGAIIDIGGFDLGGALDDAFGTDIFSDAGFGEGSVRITLEDGGARIDIDVENDKFDPALGKRGVYLMEAWRGFNFSMNQGKQFFLKGDNPRYPGGEQETMTFHGEVKQLPDGRDETEQPLMATACYLYSTYASPLVCIDSDPYSRGEKTCRPTYYQRSSGQGGPVAITGVSQKTSGNEVVFRIELENIGDGTVYNPLRIQSCSPYYPLPAKEKDVNTLMLGMVYIGEDMLECTPAKHKIRLYNGKGVVKCVYDLEDQELTSRTAYETPLVAELWYGYSETIRRNLKIERI